MRIIRRAAVRFHWSNAGLGKYLVERGLAGGSGGCGRGLLAEKAWQLGPGQHSTGAEREAFARRQEARAAKQQRRGSLPAAIAQGGGEGLYMYECDVCQHAYADHGSAAACEESHGRTYQCDGCGKHFPTYDAAAACEARHEVRGGGGPAAGGGQQPARKRDMGK